MWWRGNASRKRRQHFCRPIQNDQCCCWCSGLLCRERTLYLVVTADWETFEDQPVRFWHIDNLTDNTKKQWQIPTMEGYFQHQPFRAQWQNTIVRQDIWFLLPVLFRRNVWCGAIGWHWQNLSHVCVVCISLVLYPIHPYQCALRNAFIGTIDSSVIPASAACGIICIVIVRCLCWHASALGTVYYRTFQVGGFTLNLFKVEFVHNANI